MAGIKRNVRKSSDKESVPQELTTHQNQLSVTDILDIAPGNFVEFSYGDFIPNADGFNTYLEANCQPGQVIKIERDHCIALIKSLAMNLNSAGLTSLPMLCLAEECVIYDSCPLATSGMDVPKGKPCPIERTQSLNYVRNLQADFGEGRTFVDQILINAVAGTQMLLGRVNGEMSKNPNPIVEVDKGVDARGNVIREKVENPAYKAMNTLQKSQQSMLKALAMTQEQRLKVDGSGQKSSDQHATSIKQKLKEVRMKSKSTSLDVEETIQDAEFRVVAEQDQSNNNQGTSNGINSENQSVQDTTGTGTSSETEAGGIQTSASTRYPREDHGDVGETPSKLTSFKPRRVGESGEHTDSIPDVGSGTSNTVPRENDGGFQEVE
jgi:hypothetical protein